MRSATQPSLTVPATGEKVSCSSTTRAGEPRQIGRPDGCPWVRTSRRATGELALRTAPVPLGKIGSEKETSLRLLRLTAGALQSRSTEPSRTPRKRSSPCTGTPAYRQVGKAEVGLHPVRHQLAQGDRVAGGGAAVAEGERPRVRLVAEPDRGGAADAVERLRLRGPRRAEGRDDGESAKRRDPGGGPPQLRCCDWHDARPPDEPQGVRPPAPRRRRRRRGGARCR